MNVKNAGRVYRQGKSSLNALESVSCEVVRGDRIAIVGPSGSGKSTLLYIMGGIDSPTSGTVSWPTLGKKDNLRPRKIGFVFQTPSLFPPLTVMENVELPLLLTGINPQIARSEALLTLTYIGLKSIAYKLPEELSGGQAQRAALCRALAPRPTLILADEPTGQLDHPTARRLFDTLFKIAESEDITVVVSTHDPAIAKRMRTVWRINHGKLEAEK